MMIVQVEFSDFILNSISAPIIQEYVSILNNDNLEFFLLLLVSEVEAEKDNNDDHSKKENLQGSVKIFRKKLWL